jgi:CubicO group peptidase (beta-lactamase class C family)
VVVVGAVAYGAWRYRPDLAIKVGTASVSETLCAGVFVSSLDAGRVFNEEIRPQKGLRILLKRLHYTVDKEHQQVVTTWAGHFASVATFRKAYGCTLGTRTDALRWPSPDVTEAPGKPANAKLEKALDRAFAEPARPPFRQVRAIVVMRDGQFVAERYAPGIGPGTPLVSYSVSKSVINALIGILVGDGKLDLYKPGPVRAWSSPSDPRHAITLDELLRMTSGLSLEESDSGFDPVSRMLFLERDMAGFAERAKLKAKPGETWEYTSGNTLIVSAILRDAVGGHAGDVWQFAARRLFQPLEMQHVAMEFDEAGTPIGSTRIYASARDWARFGNLYLNDGVVNGKRILPEGWVAYSTRQTLDSPYGAGFWVKTAMPADAYFASGNFGQRIVIVPSERLVIVRFGITVDPPNFDMKGLIRLVKDVIAAR